jgi:hypothetical protein
LLNVPFGRSVRISHAERIVTEDRCCAQPHSTRSVHLRTRASG